MATSSVKLDPSLSSNVTLTFTTTKGTPNTTGNYTPVSFSVKLNNPYGTYTYSGSGTGYQVRYLIENTTTGKTIYNSGYHDYNYKIGTIYPVSFTENVYHNTNGSLPNQTYKITFTKANRGSNSTSLTETFTTIPRHVQMNAPTLSSSTRNSITFKWSSASTISSFRYKVGTGNWVQSTVNASSGTITASVSNGSHLITVDGYANGLWSSSASPAKSASATLSTAAQATLTSLTAGSIGTTTATLSWKSSATINKRAHNTIATAANITSISAATSGAISLSGLSPNTSYTYYMWGYDAVTGAITASRSVTFTTAFTSVTSVTATAPVKGSNHQVLVTYRQTGAINSSTAYKVEYSLNDSTWHLVTSSTTGVNTNKTFTASNVPSAGSTIYVRLTLLSGNLAASKGSRYGTPYSAPTFTLSTSALSDKSGISYTVSNASETSTYRYRWKLSTGSYNSYVAGATSQRIIIGDNAPGKSYILQVEMTGNTSGLSTVKTSGTIAVAPLVTVGTVTSSVGISFLELTMTSNALYEVILSFPPYAAEVLKEFNGSKYKFEHSEFDFIQPGQKVEYQVRKYDMVAYMYGPAVTGSVTIPQINLPTFTPVVSSPVRFSQKRISVKHSSNADIFIEGYELNGGAFLPLNTKYSKSSSSTNWDLTGLAPGTSYSLAIYWTHEFNRHSSKVSTVSFTTAPINTSSSFTISNYTGKDNALTVNFNQTGAASRVIYNLEYLNTIDGIPTDTGITNTTSTNANTFSISAGILQAAMESVSGSSIQFSLRITSVEDKLSGTGTYSRGTHVRTYTLHLTAAGEPSPPIVVNYTNIGGLIPDDVITTKNNLLLTFPANSSFATYGASTVERRIKIGNRAEIVRTSNFTANLETPITSADVGSKTNDIITITDKDSRGILLSSSMSFNIIHFKPLSINITGVSREGSFGDTLLAGESAVTYMNFTSGTVTNQVEYFHRLVKEEGAPDPSPTSLSTTNLSRELEPIPGTFDTSNAYVVVYKIKETLSSEQIITIRIPKGKPIMFMDTPNNFVGINTVSPIAALDVVGDIVGNNIFYFLEGDPDNDIEADYEIRDT